MLVTFPLAILVTGLMLFLPAGSLRYWQAWMVIPTLFLPALFVGSYFLRRDPGLLARRMQFKEKEPEEKVIVKLANLAFFFVFRENSYTSRRQGTGRGVLMRDLEGYKEYTQKVRYRLVPEVW